MEQAMLVTNLAARTVSERVKQVIVKALSADLKLDVVDTKGRDHATELAREAADRGFDLVISFGGDGTMNEVANGLAGSDTSMAILPGGMANVLCRVIGIPVDIVEATGYLLNRVKDGKTRRINIGRVDDRHFVLSCGVGLDAETVKRVEANPAAKAKFRDWFFVYSVFRAFFSQYRGRDSFVHMSADGIQDEFVTAIVCNTPHFTYFKNRPVIVAPEARMEDEFDVVGVRRFPTSWIPGLAAGILKTGKHVKKRHIRYMKKVERMTFETLDRPFPVQLDGEYLGERLRVEVELVRDGLSILG